uniref:RING-type domain-containing protein n=1 Tax=Macrostomum lignano TaxID=282301 RepID=A0A1I8GQ11_9PLAT
MSLLKVLDVSSVDIKDLRCPVCKTIFTDPCFVCPNHHTVCRECHRGILETTPYAAKCPECREKLITPKQDAAMAKLIKVFCSKALLGATCEGEGEGETQCSYSVLVNCGHCDKNLCDVHFSDHRLKFQTECLNLLSTVEKDAKECEQVSAKLQPWKAQKKILSNLSEAKAISDRLKAATAEAPKLESKAFGSPPTNYVADGSGQRAPAIKTAPVGRPPARVRLPGLPRSGEKNTVPDFLSQHGARNDSSEEDPAKLQVNAVLRSGALQIVSPSELAEASLQDPVISQAIEMTLEGWPTRTAGRSSCPMISKTSSSAAAPSTASRGTTTRKATLHSSASTITESRRQTHLQDGYGFKDALRALLWSYRGINSTMERLISSSHLIPQEGATCRWKDEAGQCTIPVFVKCRHCDRRLCSRHFSIHWMQFEADCTNLVDRVQQQTAEADRVNASLQPWNSLIVGLIEFLDMEKKRLQDLLNSATPKADWAALAVRKRAEAAALQAALASDDQRAARAKFDQLRGLVEASKATFGLENVGPPPTDEQRREIDKAKRLQDLLNSATPKADWAASAVRKRAEAAALQAALASDDQRAARAKFDQLRGLAEASKATFGLENVGPPPTDEQRREIDKAKSAIDTIVGTMVGTCGGIDDLIGVCNDEFDVYAVCDGALDAEEVRAYVGEVGDRQVLYETLLSEPVRQVDTGGVRPDIEHKPHNHGGALVQLHDEMLEGQTGDQALHVVQHARAEDVRQGSCAGRGQLDNRVRWQCRPSQHVPYLVTTAALHAHHDVLEAVEYTGRHEHSVGTVGGA